MDGTQALIGRVIGAVTSRPSDLPAALADVVRAHFEIDHVTLVGFDLSERVARILAARGNPPCPIRGTTAPLDMSSRWLAVSGGEPWYSSDFTREPNYTRYVDQSAMAVGLRSGCSVPVLCRGEVRGAVMLSAVRYRTDWPEVIAQLTAAAPLIGLAVHGIDGAPPRVCVVCLDPLLAHGVARLLEHDLGAHVLVLARPQDLLLTPEAAATEVVVAGVGMHNPDLEGLFETVTDAGLPAPELVVVNGGAVPAAELDREGATWMAREDVPRRLSGVVAQATARHRNAPVGVPVPRNGGVTALTPRELQLLQGLSAGRSFDQIAAALGLSTLTVRGYSRGLYAKLQVSSRAEAVREAWRLGLVDMAANRGTERRRVAEVVPDAGADLP